MNHLSGRTQRGKHSRSSAAAALTAGGLLAVISLFVGACGGGGGEEAQPTPTPSASVSPSPAPSPTASPDPIGPPQEASVTVPVQVPASMRTSPFDVARNLVVPSGFGVAVHARIPGVRFLAAAPNGDLFASQPGGGRVWVIRPDPAGGDPTLTPYVSGLRNPHDIVFHQVGGQWYVYIAESHQINRFVYNPGDTGARGREILVTGLPDNSSPELQGRHGHMLKNIAVDSMHRLYVSSASATNADPLDVQADPPRAAILLYNPDGSGQRVFARGLRNAEGLAFAPGTDDLWVVVNNRDNLRYPFNDSTGWYGQVIPEYVDNHPPEEFTRVRDGGNYGWPFANPNPDSPSGMNDMPFDPDYENNRDGSVVDVNSFDRITKGMPAHTAPLGLLFFGNTNLFASQWRNGAAVAMHGSWNRTRLIGYKVVYFPWAAGRPGQQMDMIRGWLDEGTQVAWGRPVDVAVDSVTGAMYVSDDQSGTIYRMTATVAP